VGVNDAQEMLDVAKAENVRLEQENARLATALARVRALEPTWHRGMYGTPDDMFARIQITRALDDADIDAAIAARERTVWRQGYSDGNLDGYFGTRDKWREHGEAD
jgi:hypothetical protein